MQMEEQCVLKLEKSSISLFIDDNRSHFIYYRENLFLLPRGRIISNIISMMIRDSNAES